jgi:hypothetical protein
MCRRRCRRDTTLRRGLPSALLVQLALSMTRRRLDQWLIRGGYGVRMHNVDICSCIPRASSVPLTRPPSPCLIEAPYDALR